ncbi:hypothetical protein HU200_004137 [Digitaria exilis]|uniref:Uncharacterized protein n=1 Tax=Digitaria exilis TaxID=1010633 RepID=A0A835FVD7_9POAL|nr:hypothetical protein HU200_004137 [Digitaria exilis]
MESLYDLDLMSRTVPVILDNPRSWFMECKDRTKRSSVMFTIHFPANNGNKEAEGCSEQRSAYAKEISNILMLYHFILFLKKMKEILGDYDAIHYICWAYRYKLAYSSNFSSILDPIIQNNYQLFMVERLIMQGAKTFVKTMKEFDNDLALCDDPKKNTKDWQEPVYTDD